VVLDVRSAQIWIDCKHVRVEKVCKDWNSVLDHGHGRKRKQHRSWSNRIESRSGIEGIEWQLSGEKVLRERVVEQTPTCAYDCLVFSVNIPCDSHARREIIPV